MKRPFSSLFIFSFILILSSCSPQEVDLSGSWNFEIDREDIGETELWFTKKLPETVELPGSMVENGKGDEISMETYWLGGMRNPEWYDHPNYAPYHDPDNIRIPYWLQPEKKYYGAAWYQREVEIPKSWKDKSLSLYLERVHWESTLWFDDKVIGTQNSLGTSHEYEIPGPISPGRHLITIRVDNRMKEVDVGWDSHSVSDHTQSNWNGIVGELKIIPLSEIQIRDIRITSNIDAKNITVNGIIFNAQGTRQKAEGKSRVEGSGLKKKVHVFDLVLEPGENNFTYTQELGGDILLWDEFDPNLYKLELEIEAGKETDKIVESFGFREVEAGTEGLKINKRPLFLRGTLECAIFPLTGYPSTDSEEWKRILRVVKSHGLNHMRFHSWCPPEAAFIAADEIGIYLQVECSSWANSTSRIGDGYLIDTFIWDESRQIIAKYGNHPSFIMLAYGNEPAGANQNLFLSEFVSYWKKNDPRRLYTSAAGWPILPVNDFHNVPQQRIQGWGEQLNSIINSKPPSSAYDWTSRLPADGIPVVSHEIGQWCVYPNFKEIPKYTGVLKAKNFEIFQESLEANNMGELADSFLLASGKLQALCYKADIEAALRTPKFGGFQLLDLHDFPGQGTALVGVLDPFWGEKGYISPEEFSAFCAKVVPLARLEKHIFTEGETMEVPIQVAWYDKAEGRGQKAEIRLKDKEGKVIRSELFDNLDIPIGNSFYVGNFKHTFEKTGNPRQLVLETSVGDFSNSWNIWVYPQSTDLLIYQSTDLKISSRLDLKTLDFLKEGGSVLLSLGKGKVAPEFGGEVGVGFSSIFWNTAWTGGQKPHTLGILCNPDHPALADFPTEYHSNWQWWDAMAHADAINMAELSGEIDPIVKIIDDWVTNRQLALVMEAKVGEGKIIISGADLHSDLESRPGARQLLKSLKSYMESENFDPKVKIDPTILGELMR